MKTRNPILDKIYITLSVKERNLYSILENILIDYKEDEINFDDAILELLMAIKTNR